MKQKAKKKYIHDNDDETLLDREALDIDAMINSVTEARLDSSVIDRISAASGDIRPAENIVEWITDRQFSYLGADPFPKQLEMLVKTLEEWCPSKKCTDRHFWRNVPVDVPLYDLYDRVTFLRNGVCPKCGKDKLHWINKKEGGFQLHGVEELVGVLGMRSAKTTSVSGMLAPYLVQRYVTLPTTPSRYYGLLEGKSLYMSFVAITAGQAEETLWQGFKDALDESVWFKNYFDYLKSRGNDIGAELLQYKNTFLWLPTSRLHCTFIPPNMRTMRGRTRFFAAIDELGWFSNVEGRVSANATETYEALRKSLRTIRSAHTNLIRAGVNNPPPALQVSVGSPYEANDKIMELLRSTNGSKRKLGFHYATWDFNPNIKKDDPGLMEEAKDEVIFMRDFGAEPPMSSNPLIGLKPEQIQTLVTKDPMLFDVKPITVLRKDRPYVAGELANIIQDLRVARMLTVDAGETQNSFALAVLSIDFSDSRNCISVDAVGEIRPTSDKSVSFPVMLELVMKIINMFNVLYVYYDRWQATHHVQAIADAKFKHIRNEGPISERYSLSYKDLHEVRDVFYSPDRIKLPRSKYVITEQEVLTSGFERYLDDPVSSLLVQAMTVRDVGNKVMKPLNGNDDIFRAVALGVCRLLDPEIVAEFKKYSGKTIGKSSGRGVGIRSTIRASLLPKQSSSIGVSSNIGITGLSRPNLLKRGTK